MGECITARECSKCREDLKETIREVEKNILSEISKLKINVAVMKVKWTVIGSVVGAIITVVIPILAQHFWK